MIANRDAEDRHPSGIDAEALLRRVTARAELYAIAQLEAEAARLGLHPCDWGASLWPRGRGRLQLDLSGRLVGHEVPREAVDAYARALSEAGLPIRLVEPGDGTYWVESDVVGHSLEVWGVVDWAAFLESLGGDGDV